MRYFKILITLIFILFSCSSQKEISEGSVLQVESDMPTGHGLWYYLPKTAIEVEIIAEKHVEKVGPFFRFAQRFLNISDVITEDKEHWQIVGARISTSGIVDKQKLYRINISGTPSIAALNYADGGILRGVNIDCPIRAESVDDFVFEPVISLSSVNFNDVPFTEEQMIRTSTTAMAEEVAKEVFRLRDIRTNILEGDVDLLPPDKGAYQMVIDEIDRKEKAYIELFSGKKLIQRHTKTYRFVPEKGDLLNIVLLRFSSQKGFLDEADVSGTPVYLELEVNENLAKNFLEDEHNKSPNRKGLVYCNPVPANVRVVDRTLLLASEEIFLAQFGQLLRLPEDLLDKPGVSVELDETTGSLKNISYK